MRTRALRAGAFIAAIMMSDLGGMRGRLAEGVPPMPWSPR